MLNQPASTGSANTAAWDRSALVARLCQKPLEQPWSQCWASRRSRELGLSHVFNIHLGMLRNSFQLQDSGITWAILSQRSIRNMFYLILIASRSWAHRQHWAGINHCAKWWSGYQVVVMDRTGCVIQCFSSLWQEAAGESQEVPWGCAHLGLSAF